MLLLIFGLANLRLVSATGARLHSLRGMSPPPWDTIRIKPHHAMPFVSSEMPETATAEPDQPSPWLAIAQPPAVHRLSMIG